MKTRWDSDQAEEYWRKHGVSFAEAQTIFLDPLIVSVYDSERSKNEERRLAIGQSMDFRLLAVAYTIRGDQAWIISARVPTPAEKRR